MEVDTSNLIAIGSLIVASLALGHSVKSSRSTSAQINKISNDHLRLASNVALTDASRKYVLLLSDVSRQFELITTELAYPALVASRSIGECFDKYDTGNDGHTYLRHCFHTAIVIIKEAYDHELTYQTGLNLTHRIRLLKHIKYDAHHYEKSTSKKSIFSFLNKERLPQSPEDIINSSTVFWDSVKEIYNRIPSGNESQLFSDTLACLEEYRKLHESKREQLQELEEKLEVALKENALEVFKIENMPNLDRNFYRVKGDIGRYRELYFPDFYGIESMEISDGIGHSIYAGSISFIASQYLTWGESNRAFQQASR